LNLSTVAEDFVYGLAEAFAAVDDAKNALLEG
jgi:hypothetical protein